MPHAMLVDVLRMLGADQRRATVRTFDAHRIAGKKRVCVCVHVSLKMLDRNDSELMNGVGVPAVKQEDVETDCEGERGQ
jgi:hypothetical protein